MTKYKISMIGYQMLLKDYKKMLKDLNDSKKNKGKLPDYYDWNTKISGVKANIRIKKENYQDAIDRVNAFIKKEKKDPNYVTIKGQDQDSGPSGKNITSSFKPSCNYCNSKLPYTLYKTTFENKCIACGAVGSLVDTPKDPERTGKGKTNDGNGVPEGEWTCKKCDADYCGVCGKDKWPKNRWLKQINVPSKVKLK